MEYNNDYLDKMLNFAVSRYNFKPENSKKIPEYLNNLESAINSFKNALEHEAYYSMQKKENNIDNPMLYSVNLDTKEPGLVIGGENEKLLVHTKQKINDTNINKKVYQPKSLEKMEKEATKSMEKIIKKQQKEEFEMDIKKKDKNVKNTEKIMTKKQKKEEKTNKLENDISKLNNIPNKTTKQTDKLGKNLNQLDKLKDELKLMDLELENNMKTYENDKLVVNEYNHKKEIAKLEKLEKQSQKPKKEKNKKDDENEDNEKKKKKPEKLEKKHIIICDEENDILTDFHNLNKEENSDYNTFTSSKEINKDNVVFYPSPVPIERHLTALDKCDPNPALLPTLLYGKNVNNSHEMINLYHGPPGTGKTYRLITELEKLLNTTKTGKIFVCAPSNIGVINLYQKAIDFDIYGRLLLSKDYSEYIPEVNDKEKINQRLIFSTISMREGKILKNMEFNTIFIDEAAQCQEAIIWGLLRKTVTKIYMAGDPLQLPSLVSENGKKLEYGRSMMERLINMDVPIELLNVQRRMNPIIAEFSNQKCYKNQLLSDYNGDSKGRTPLEVIHIEGKEELIGTSYCNKLEANKILETVKDIESTFKNIVIIAPYKAQCSILKELLSKSQLSYEVHTLDSFQGKEADVIILSTVRSGEQTGFWNDYRRLNVGLTRAKHVLRIIGNTNTWKCQPGPLNDFYQFYKTI